MKTVAMLYSGGRQWGGIETYLLHLFRLNDGQRVRLVLLSMGDWDLTRAVAALAEQAASEPSGLGAAPIACRVLSSRRVRLRTIGDIREALGAEGAKLLVSQGVVANAYARLAARAARVPHLVVVHSDLANDYPRLLPRLLYRWVDRLLRPLTDRYITVAAFLKERLVAAGIDPDRVRVIYNGVAVGGLPGHEDFPRQTTTKVAPADLRTQGGRPTLVSIGRLHPVKNFDSLVRAMKWLPEEVVLEIWGSGPEEDRLRALIDTLGFGGRVKLCGEAPGVEPVLARADVYVQPSRSEGCSFAVMEAMLAGKPVVVAPCGGMPEQVKDGLTGVVASGTGPEELAAAIRRVLDDQSLAGRVAQAAQETARLDFSLERWLEETVSAFLEAAR